MWGKTLLLRVCDGLVVVAVVLGIVGWNIGPTIQEGRVAAAQVQSLTAELGNTNSLLTAAKDENATLRKEAKRDALVIRDIDPGGSVATYDTWWHRVADSGVRVVIDGDCVSACALFMGIVPPANVCMTDRASVGLHMASDQTPQGKMVPDAAFTAFMVRRYYPPVVQEWIKSQGGLTPEVKYMYLADFKGYYRKCKPEEYQAWPVTFKSFAF